jgi:hypothetical protein
MQRNNKPLGVLILGGISCFGLGLFFFILSLAAFFSATPEDTDQLNALIQKKGLDITLTTEHFKMISAFQVATSCMFFIVGRGILLGKYWARNTMIYVSFFWAFVLFAAAIINPSFIQYFIVQMVYPGVLILYFTNKNVERYFVAQKIKR